MVGKATRPSTLLQRLASTPTPIERPEPTPASQGAAEESASEPVKIRLSVDLDDAQFEFLTIFAMRQKVSKVEVMRALMAEMQADPSLAGRVSERLPKRRRK